MLSADTGLRDAPDGHWRCHERWSTLERLTCPGRDQRTRARGRHDNLAHEFGRCRHHALQNPETPTPCRISRGILIYPVKILAPVTVQEVTILKSGTLADDRAFALFDHQDKFVNGKRHSRIHWPGFV